MRVSVDQICICGRRETGVFSVQGIVKGWQCNVWYYQLFLRHNSGCLASQLSLIIGFVESWALTVIAIWSGMSNLAQGIPNLCITRDNVRLVYFLYSYCRYLIPNSGPSIFNYVYHHVEGKTSNYVPIINSLLSRYIDERNQDTGKIVYHFILMYSWWLGLAKALAKPTCKIVYSLMYYFMSAQIFRTIESLLTTGTWVFAFLLHKVNLRQPVACNSC